MDEKEQEDGDDEEQMNENSFFKAGNVYVCSSLNKSPS